MLFIDNVDQFTSEYQANVFLLAQKISKDLNSITIVSLREESYFSPNVQKTFTAYINKKYHISSPPFRQLVNKRIDYVLQRILNQKNTKKLPSDIQKLISHKDDLIDFLNIIQESIFQENKNIASFIDPKFNLKRNA